MATITGPVLWAAFACWALLALSGYVRMARTERGWRDAGCWRAPLAFTSGMLWLAAVLGLVPAVPGLALSVAVFLPVAVWVWRESAGTVPGKAGAARFAAGLLWGLIRDSLWNVREDVRELGGKVRHASPAAPAGAPAPVPVVAVAPAAGPAAPRTDAATLMQATRNVPPLRQDDRLGSLPAPAAVAAGLEAAGAMVPPVFLALAEYIRDFDPAGDEEEELTFIEGLAAGWLTVSEAHHDLAESQLNDVGLDPVFAVGLIDVGDDVGDLAGVIAHLNLRYHELYEGIHGHVDAGGTLPVDARGYFNAAGGDAAPGGAAA